MIYKYKVPFPSIGMSNDLKHVKWSSDRILNSTRYTVGDTIYGYGNFPVLRWTEPDAEVAERIMRREWERRLGAQFVNTEVGVWMIQALVQSVANETCGTWNARPSDQPWKWVAWARFAKWTATLSNEHFMELMGDINQSLCEKYAVYLVDDVLEGSDSDLEGDPWYSEPYVWQLPAQGPYDFTSPPVGYPGSWTAPPGAMPPPGDQPLPPGDQPLPPGDQPLPPLPQPDQPGGIGPAGYEYDRPPAPDKEPASVWQWLFAGALGLSGLLFVGATLWGMPDRKENPVGRRSSKGSGY